MRADAEKVVGTTAILMSVTAIAAMFAIQIVNILGAVL